MSEKAEGFSPEELQASIENAAEECGLRKDFISDLLVVETNDWSFVVKTHALLESVVCQLLAAHLRQPALEYVLAQKVEMEARIEMLKALELASDQQRTMMRLLGRIRNNLVHNAAQTDFRFDDYLKNKDNRRNFGNAFGAMWPDRIADKPREYFVVRTHASRSGHP